MCGGTDTPASIPHSPATSTALNGEPGSVVAGQCTYWLGIVEHMTTSDLMPRPVEVRALEPYRIWLRYDDGVEGEVDLSHLVGKGMFTAWEDAEFFAGVYIGPIGGISWSERVDLCPDALHMRLTGTSALGADA